MRDATYVLNGEVVVGATSLDVFADSQVAIARADAREAQMLAMLAAGLARPSQGSVLIGEYDPRVQPVHCKRLAGFVPHDPLPLAPSKFARYIDYRAALWDIDTERARAHAAALLDRLSALHEAFAYPIVAALIASPELLVLDRPQPRYASDVLKAAGRTAVFSTHLDTASASAYTMLDAVRTARGDPT